MVRLALVVVAILAFAGCKTDTGCTMPGKQGCPDSGAVTTCKMSSDCKDMTLPACDTTNHICVQCLSEETTACKETTPVCKNNQCAACTQHNDCKTACLSNGSCASTEQVAYVNSSSASDNPDCNQERPCKTVMAALATKRPYVRLHGKINGPASINDQTVTLVGDPDPGATLTRDDNGPILQITGTSTVKIDTLQISGAKGPNNSGISIPMNMNNNVTLSMEQAIISNNEGIGITCYSGGTLNISRSAISLNKGGGISSGDTPIALNITNTFIYRNGNPDKDNGSTVGGISFTPLSGSGNRFEFNTIVDNQVKDGSALSGGIKCDQSGFTAPNNIIARNNIAGDPSKPNANTVGLCTYPTSTIASDPSMMAALKFQSPDTMPYTPMSYHINSGSSAIGKATTSSPITIDYDNQIRPPDARDQGADQHQ